MDQNSTISNRIKQLIDKFADGNNSKFAVLVGTSEANVRNYINGTSPKLEILNAIVIKFEISYEWLLAGKGEMFQENKPVAIIADGEGMPLVEIEAVGGFGNDSFTIDKKDIIGHYAIPDFEQASFMIRVRGESMAPHYNSGDLVACKVLRESQFIQWNEVHVIATREQGILIKRLRQGGDEETLLAVSENPEYSPFDIPKKEITGIALVLGGVRLE